MIDIDVDIRELKRQLRAAAGQIDDLRDVHAKAAAVAEKEAERRAPRGKTLRLVGTIRSSGQANTGVIRAGYARLRYPVYVHYGTKYMRARPYIDEAVAAKTPQIEDVYDRGISDLLHRLGLD